jgi:diadenosine tetraphosphatase ApaH/serine/threonine PP2A family protein phosphatase
VRIAIISDIHGNREALDTVLAVIDTLDCEKIFCLGDVIGYGPDPGYCIEVIQERCELILAGNHEYAVLGKINVDYFNPHARQATLWTRGQLSEAQIKIISGYPLTHVWDKCTFVHGTLDSPDLFDYIQTSYDAHLSLARLETKVCFIGHSHVPVAFLQTDDVITYSTDPAIDLGYAVKSIVNVGSVGQPRDGNPNASFATFDLTSEMVELHRVSYDLAATQMKIMEAGLPAFLAERLAVGR